MFGFDGHYSAGHFKRQSLTFEPETHKKSAIRHSTEKPILINFVNNVLPKIAESFIYFKDDLEPTVCY